MFDTSTIAVPDHIENPSAYRAAVARKIEARIAEARAKKAGQKRTEWFLEKFHERTALIEELHGLMLAGTASPFLRSMWEAYTNWGALTERQEAALSKALYDRQLREEQRKVEQAELAARSQFVGQEKQRREFRLTMVRKFYSPNRGFWINLLDDEHGNRICYAGNELDLEQGATETICATVTGHEDRDGVRKTWINRPKIRQGSMTEADFLAGRFAAGAQGIKL